MEQKLPFEKSAELPAGTCAEGAATVDGEMEYCDDCAEELGLLKEEETVNE